MTATPTPPRPTGPPPPGDTNPSTALYDALAPIYDAWQEASGAAPFSALVVSKLEPALQRWGREIRGPDPHQRAAAHVSGGVTSFLDLGCGTGELLLALRRRHPAWRLAGLDASTAMLAVARRKIPAAAAIHWIQGDVTRPPLDAPVDAVGCFYDTINHLPDLPALDRLVGSVAAALPPRGLLIFDVTNPLGFAQWWGQSNRWSGVGWSLTVETRFNPQDNVGHADVTVVREGAEVRAPLIQRCFRDADVRAMLVAHHLTVEVAEPWSPFSFDAPGKTWWIARKTTS